MDQRQTFASPEELKTILEGIFFQKQKAAFIADKEGLFRTSGTIKAISDNDVAKDTVLTLDNELSLRLEEIIAVNGIFRADYSEC